MKNTHTDAGLFTAMAGLQLHEQRRSESFRRAEKAAFDPAWEAMHVARITLNRTVHMPAGDIPAAIAALADYAVANGWGVKELMDVRDEVPCAFDLDYGLNVQEDIERVVHVINAVRAQLPRNANP